MMLSTSVGVSFKLTLKTKAVVLTQLDNGR
jgi:hypothetical protein